ncbi:MAG: hypothetical protein ACHREM_03045 [Polyangiales bacterium]
MNYLTRGLAVLAMAAPLAVDCGGQTVAPAAVVADAGSDSVSDVGGESGDSSACLGTRTGPLSTTPAEHRPTAVTCALTPPPALPDGGVSPGCSADADCPTGMRCLQHSCSYDRCLVDADCTTGQVCVCNATAGGGLRVPGNLCVAAACATDADCGGNGAVCAATRGYCGGVQGYNCTSVADTCADPKTDCPCGNPMCTYAPEVGHFMCSGPIGCSG